MCVYFINLCFCLAKQPSLKLKTRPKQLLGSLPLDITLPAYIFTFLGFSLLVELTLKTSLGINIRLIIKLEYISTPVNIYIHKKCLNFSKLVTMYIFNLLGFPLLAQLTLKISLIINILLSNKLVVGIFS